MPFQLALPGLSSPAHFKPETKSPEHDTLEAYPDVSARTISRHAKRIGRAGEQLVDSILTRYGDHILTAPEDEPFDRLVRRGDRHVTIQVKTSARAVDGFYKFSMKRGYSGSPKGIRPYRAGDYDIAALVALPENVVLFSADRRESHRIGLDQIEALRAHPRASYLRALDELGLIEPFELNEASEPLIPAF